MSFLESKSNGNNCANNEKLNLLYNNYNYNYNYKGGNTSKQNSTVSLNTNFTVNAFNKSKRDLNNNNRTCYSNNSKDSENNTEMSLKKKTVLSLKNDEMITTNVLNRNNYSIFSELSGIGKHNTNDNINRQNSLLDIIKKAKRKTSKYTFFNNKFSSIFTEDMNKEQIDRLSTLENIDKEISKLDKKYVKKISEFYLYNDD